MATLRGLTPSFTIQTGQGTNIYVIGGQPSLESTGGLLVQIVDVSSFTASTTVKGQSSEIAKLRKAGTVPADAFVPIPYRKLNLNGTVADGSLVSAALTNGCLIWIPAMGMEVALDVTFTSGVGTVYVTPCQGGFGL